jgi:AraC-like DNA-binding protein
MKRFSIKDIVALPQNGPVAIYKDQIAVFDTHFEDGYRSKNLFAIDAFAIGYTTSGSATFEFNNVRSHMETGDIFILAPTHSCRILNCDNNYTLSLLLLDSNGHNLSVHLNYMVKSERWIQTYFHPVLHLSPNEASTMKECKDRIVEQINRRNCPNKTAFIRMATVWHHVELDNIMQMHSKELTDNGKPLTRRQALARQLYRLIINNYRKEHQVRFYSDQMCLTPQYLNQITTQVFGKTLSAIISDLIFSTARSMLLASDTSIQEIADELNFADQASFSKFIKKNSGYSPNTLRKMNPHQEII